MRLKIEATPAELADKADELVKHLADTLLPVAPDLADRLLKAVKTESKQMTQPALREIHEVTRKAYDDRIKWMLKDVGKVLDRAVMSKGDPDADDEGPKEKLEPGDLNPDTGEEVPEEDPNKEDDDDGSDDDV